MVTPCGHNLFQLNRFCPPPTATNCLVTLQPVWQPPETALVPRLTPPLTASPPQAHPRGTEAEGHAVVLRENVLLLEDVMWRSGFSRLCRLEHLCSRCALTEWRLETRQ